MLLTVLGSSGTYPAVGNPGSGYLISTETTTVLLDLGPGVFPVLRGRIDRPDAIVLTHAHPDHCADLFPLLNEFRFGRPDVRGVPVMTPPGVSGRFAAFLDADDDHDMYRVFSFEEVGAGEERVVGDVTLDFGAATHPVPALVVAAGGGGRRLVYSGDTGPGGDLEALAVGADVLLCEASLQGTPGEGRFPYHLYAAEAGAVAARAGVGRLIVTHIPPTLDPAVSVAEAAAVFDGPVLHAVPGMEVDV